MKQSATCILILLLITTGLSLQTTGFLQSNSEINPMDEAGMQERLLSGGTFSNTYASFGNITSTRTVDIHVTDSGDFLTCGGIKFNEYQANALIGITKSDGSNQVQLAFGTHAYDYCLSITQKANGEIIALGDSNSEESLNDLMLTRLTKEGQIVEIQSLGSKFIDKSSYLYARKNGGYIVAGTRTTTVPNEKILFMIEFNEQDQVIRTESSRIGGQQIMLGQIIEDKDQNIWICGLFTSILGIHSFLAKFSPSLQLQFYKEIKNEQGTLRIASLSELGNSIILAGSLYSEQLYPTVLSISKNAEVEWSKFYQLNITTYLDHLYYVHTSQNQIVVSGYFYVNEALIMKLNSQGDITWTSTFARSTRGFPYFPGTAYKAQILQDGSVLSAGYFTYYGQSTNNGFLVKTDSEGWNLKGVLITVNFVGYNSTGNAMDISLQDFEPLIQDLELTINPRTKTYQVFSIDFQEKIQTLLYSILPSSVAHFDKYKTPFYILIGVSGCMVIIVLLLLAWKLKVCLWLKKNRGGVAGQADNSVHPIVPNQAANQENQAANEGNQAANVYEVEANNSNVAANINISLEN